MRPVLLCPAAIAAIATGQPALPAAAASEPPSASSGGLYARTPDGQARPLTLTHTRVDATVTGNLSRVHVTQVFHNPYAKPLEAIYAFPLPEDAAVDAMTVRLGARVIVGQIKRRAEARRLYDQAKASGQTAALLDQERENLFTQAVANVLPGEDVEVAIAYSDALKFEDDGYAFSFPMVVGPRYVPAGGVVKDAAKVVPPHLPVGRRSGRDIELTLRLDGGAALHGVRSTTHAITYADGVVRLAAQDRIPNRDFVLRYAVSGQATHEEVFTRRDARGGHFAAFLVPAVKYRDDEVTPKDVVFLMDTSGSQDGEPIVQSKALMHRMIDGLNGDDTFTIIDFADAATRLSRAPLRNTAANRRMAHRYVDRLSANGGTELNHGIDTVLAFPPAPGHRLRSVVLVTDGLIGDDERVIATVKAKLPRRNRLYAFGVGPSTNRYLLERLAEVGRGTCTVVDPREPLRRVAERFYRQINDPVLTDIAVEWRGEGPAPITYPSQPRDLFTGQPIVVYGRKEDAAEGVLHVTGRLAGGKPYERDVPVRFAEDGNPAIAQLWGRARLKQLMLDMVGGETEAGKADATATALAYQLMSKYTSFVAVTQEARTAPTEAPLVERVPQEPARGLTALAYGDPHVVTGDGLKFDMSLPGDFVVMRSRRGDLAIHARVGAGLLDVAHTYNLAIAVRLGATTVAYDARRRVLLVDGVRLLLSPGQAKELPGGIRLKALARGWEVRSAAGDVVTLTPVGDHVDYHVAPAQGRPSGDLMGAVGTIDADEDAANDLRDRDGRVVAPPTGPVSEARFLEGWRVRPEERLLEAEPLGPLPLVPGMTGGGQVR